MIISWCGLCPTGLLPAAIADFTMAIANNPKDAEAYNNRGHAEAQQGNLAQAISDYTRGH